MIHSEVSVKEKIDCLEYISKNLEFISDEAVHSVIKSFKEIAMASSQGANFKFNLTEQKQTGKVTSHIMDMIEHSSYSPNPNQDHPSISDKNKVRNIRELLNIMTAVLLNKSNVKLLST